MTTNVQVLRKFEDGSCKVEVEGVQLSLSAGRGGVLSVSWASDWERLHELCAAGLLRRVFHRQLFGHQDFHPAGALLAAVSK
jgi:hypothetical protein